MTRVELQALIDRVIGTKGIMRSSAWWVRKLFNKVLEYVESYTNNAVANAKVKSDTEMSDESTNPVQNKVIKAYVDKKAVELSVNVTYQELVNLRKASKLQAGQMYRITDYVTTTALEGSQSAGNVFDVVVTAIDSKRLSDIAYACISARNTSYFAENNLSAWQLKYSLDNDTERFPWADKVNGRGVIYYLIDEFYNEAPYDFKNIQFVRKLTNYGSYAENGVDTPVYTYGVFNRGSYRSGSQDNSLSAKCHHNILQEGTWDCVMLGSCDIDHKELPFAYVSNNTIGANCSNITLYGATYSATDDGMQGTQIGAGCYNIEMVAPAFARIGAICHDILVQASYAIIGDLCYNLTVGMPSTYGRECHDINEILTSGYYGGSTFGDRCYNIEFYGAGNIFGDDSRNINCKNIVYSTFQGSDNITLEYISYSSFSQSGYITGLSATHSTFIYASSITVGAKGVEYCTIRDSRHINFNGLASDVTINGSYNLIFPPNVVSMVIGPDTSWVEFTAEGTGGINQVEFAAAVRFYKVYGTVSGEYENHRVVQLVRGRNFDTVVTTNANGDVVSYSIGDLINQ